MHFKFLTYFAFLTTCLLMSRAFAAEILSDKITVFKVKPKVCIVEKQGQQCELAAQIQWQATEPLDVCLTQQVIKHKSEQKQILHCWNQQHEVFQTTELVLAQTTLMSLVDEDQMLLAQETLHVNTAKPKKQRRRLRSAWSLF